ncbi:hypothetical protein Plim_3214 [Planctopirus limnophila DSM 3776]|uniref:Uncharacterized protein n=1 Tax=Planctopirus limnophila (strain ATCC 43296 / DSM 3776 / IFAM 1008 / Mu 290) TaxID=521674 RepID=D5STJ9_PLAL2|nr:hypothetical protein [Planctopirus limnophila]ADG69028.1 hypothetical protein Plim_3214 [Planctopirus limnophila DSM 3776]
MDIKSPALLKMKGALFALLAIISGGLLLAPQFSLQALILLLITIWASCRTYYFCFYVLEHYVDPSFRYAGLWDLLRHGMQNRKEGQQKVSTDE